MQDPANLEFDDLLQAGGGKHPEKVVKLGSSHDLTRDESTPENDYVANYSHA